MWRNRLQFNDCGSSQQDSQVLINNTVQLRLSKKHHSHTDTTENLDIDERSGISDMSDQDLCDLINKAVHCKTPEDQSLALMQMTLKMTKNW
jgi:hypothetical protein